MLIVVSPTLRAACSSSWRWGTTRSRYSGDRMRIRCRLIWPPPNTTADRAAELLAATSALRYLRNARATAAPEAERLTRRIQGLCRRAGRRSESGRRLALGQRRQPAPSRPAATGRVGQRPADLGSRRLGSGLGRAAGPAHRRQGARPGRRLSQPGILQAERQRSRNPRGPAARPEHPPRRRLRGGQQLEPRSQRAVRPRPGLPGPHLRQPRSRLDRRRAARDPRAAGQDRTDRAGPARSRLTGTTRGTARPSAAPPRPPRWSPWPMPAFGPRPRSSTEPSTGCWPIAPAPAGSPTRPRARPWPPSPRITDAPSTPTIDTG